jgi:3-hydroxyisobutyrate dehydrogenase-like beta-hydroxyacid dehydrogenase
MRLGWERPGVVRATLKVEELAALVAGARMAAAAMAGRSAEQTQELEQVLAAFDRAVAHLGPVPAGEVPAVSDS